MHDLLEGIYNSHRESWEQTRLQVTSFAKVMTGEDANVALPWDEDNVPEASEEELEELRELVRKEQAALDAQKITY